MRNQKFCKSFKRGLGSIILEIRNAVDKNKYSDDILWCCLHDITYDLQVEGTKGLYIYDAICETGNKDFFEELIINKYLTSNNERFNLQSSEVLLQFALYGSERSLDALWKRYNNIFDIMKKHKANYTESCEWEDLSIRLSRVVGIKVVEKYILDIAFFLHQGKELDKFNIDWSISAFEDNFGKEKINKCLEKIKNIPGVKNILDYLEEEKKKSIEYKNKEYPVASFEEYYDKCTQSLNEKAARPNYSLYGMGRRWAIDSTKEEQIKLAQLAINEKDSSMEELLLLPFRHIDFPLNIDLLFDHLKSENEKLAKMTVELLARFQNKKIYNLAIEMIPVRGIEFVLPLFEKNYTSLAEQIIREYVLKQKNIDHARQMALRDIFEKNHPKTCGDILYHIYKNGDCAYCRYGIIKSFYKSGMLPDQLLLECIHDSYDDTRKWAAKIAKKRKIT